MNNEPLVGERAVCYMCKSLIVYVGPYWNHVGELQPKHPAIPVDEFVILWEGCCEWETFEGTLEQAIAYVKQDRRYSNYGRKGAQIIRATKLYEIRSQETEWKYV